MVSKVAFTQSYVKIALAAQSALKILKSADASKARGFEAGRLVLLSPKHYA